MSAPVVSGRSRALGLLRRILRSCRQDLPPGVQEYYRSLAITGFRLHAGEDPERTHEILDRAEQDFQWIRAKYLPFQQKDPPQGGAPPS